MFELNIMRSEDIHVGTVGYVEFQLFDREKSTRVSFGTFILCEVVNITGQQYEICAVAGDRTCLWIDKDKIYERIRG